MRKSGVPRRSGQRALLFTMALLTIAPARGGEAGSGDCVITDHGAVPGDAKTDTGPLQAAIDACAGRGGGRVVVPAGRFLTGTFRLRSAIELHLTAGAVLLGSPHLSDYPVLAGGRSDDHASARPAGRPAGPGEDTHGVRALLVAYDVEGVSITGPGVIDGNGEAFWGEGFLASSRARPDQPRPRPWLWFRGARRLTLRDVLLTHSPSYGVTLEGCDDVLVDGVRIRNDPRSPNSDGIQLEGSRNVRIVGVDVRTGDDAIVLKSSSGPIENVVVTASHLESDDAAFKLGTGSEHPIRRVRLADSVITAARYGIALFMKDGGEFSDLSATGIEIVTSSRHSTEYPVYIDVDRRSPEGRLGRIRDVALCDLRVRTRGNLLIAGHPAAPIERLTLAGLDLRVEGPVDLARIGGKPRGNALVVPLPDSVDYARENAHLTIAHVRELLARDIHVSGSSDADNGARHAILLRDVRRTRWRDTALGSRSGELAAILIDGGTGLEFDGVSLARSDAPLLGFRSRPADSVRLRAVDVPIDVPVARREDERAILALPR